MKRLELHGAVDKPSTEQHVLCKKSGAILSPNASGSYGMQAGTLKYLKAV